MWNGLNATKADECRAWQKLLPCERLDAFMRQASMESSAVPVGPDAINVKALYTDLAPLD